VREKYENIYQLKGIRGANIYLLHSADKLSLIDTGMPGQAAKILTKIREFGFNSSQLKNIILTHAHIDHIGSTKELADITSAHILAHNQESPFIEQTDILPVASGLAGLFKWLEKWLLPRSAAASVDRGLEDGERLDILGGVQVIHTPGHTPGAICLYQPEKKILFCGDTLFNQHPVTGRPGLRLPIKTFTIDRETARKSVEKLTRFSIKTIFFGHGKPIDEKGTEKIQDLLHKT
jgi:hydroxyacylglutathione hydrolase